MIRVFIGYDESEAVAYHALCHSIIKHSSEPVSVTPLVRRQLNFMHDRPRGPHDSTDFAITRFLVPAICHYQGVAIFMDCDMLVQDDICDVLSFFDGNKAVYVCQHSYVPKDSKKFQGAVQTHYKRKNWSSFMVFNNARCQMLTPEYVETAPGLDLHQFKWLEDEQIGSLPLDWNWLVGEYPDNPDAKVLHYTLGGPWHDRVRGSKVMDQKWRDAWQSICSKKMAHS